MKKKFEKMGFRISLMGCILIVLFLFSLVPAYADIAAAKKWINDEFQPSTLSQDAQLAEMEWFITAAAPLKE